MINWSPTPAEEVRQNVRFILLTGTGSVPLARDFGTPQDVLDSPMSVGGARLQAAAIRAVRTFEPRAALREVTLSGTADGKLTATATLEGA